jgi:hypothetical protein
MREDGMYFENYNSWIKQRVLKCRIVEGWPSVEIIQDDIC